MSSWLGSKPPPITRIARTGLGTRPHKSMSFRMECHVPLKLIFQTYRKLPLIFLGLYVFVRSFRILYEGAFNRNYSKSASKQAN